MDLQKMASEFAAAVMRVVQEATIDELTGNASRVTARSWADVRQSTRRPEEGIPFGDGSFLEPSTGVRYWPAKKAALVKVAKKKPSPGTNVVATVSALGTTLKMRALKRDIVKSAKKRAAKVAKKVGPLSDDWKPAKKKVAKKKAPIKKAVKRSHKKKVSR